jgi:AcrR family transcriptional regulator
MSIREAILDRAVEAVARGGEGALRVHDIAREVGCSVSALYVHFGSREGLAEAALIEHYHRQVARATEPLVAQLRRASSVTAVKRALSAHVRALCSADQAVVHLARTELVAAAHRRATVRDALATMEQWRQATFVEALMAARNRGVLRPGLDVEAAATLLRSGSLSQALVNANGDSSTTAWTKTLQWALEGVLLP